MGLLNDVLGKSVPDGNIAKPLMIALGALLVSKMMSHGGAGTEPTIQPSAPQAGSAGSPDGGLLGGLGGLLEKLQSAGHGDKVNSWVGPGQNKPIDPGQLGAALGQKTVSQAAQQAGINEQKLLSQLAKNLPGIVDKLTANGSIPSLQQVAAALTQK
ncbi:MAG: DUF937 domain-containing protein [Rhizobiales bacterium]|nr:DUF937 domain-containing protein [Hyphomicrobiales bacterium]